MSHPLGVLKNIDARIQWPREDGDFTPWLAREENIAKLGDALGLDMEVEQVEAAVGPYAADILARDTTTDQYIVIENQLEKTNHDHLGKAITYGSVLGASAIVWIASQFTEEHRRALEWLNDHTGNDLAFYGVLLELWQIDDSRPAVRFNVIARPAAIKPRDASKADDADLSETRKLQLEFWTLFRGRLLESKALPSAEQPRPRYWFNAPLGRTDTKISCIADTSANRVGVRVYLQRRIADVALSCLEKDKDAIEKELGETLIWNPFPAKLDKIIACYQPVDFSNRETWPAAVDWMVEHVVKFRKVFMPRIRRIPLQATEPQPGDEGML